MTIDEICRGLEKHKSWIKRLSKHPEDVYQDGVMKLLTLPKSKIQEFHTDKKLDAFFCRTVKNLIFDQTRRDKLIHYAYTEELDHLPSHDYHLPKTESQVIKNILESINGYWYDRVIFSLYLDKQSIRGVAKKTGIPFRSLADTINKCKKDIQNDYATN